MHGVRKMGFKKEETNGWIEMRHANMFLWDNTLVMDHGLGKNSNISSIFKCIFVACVNLVSIAWLNIVCCHRVAICNQVTTIGYTHALSNFISTMGPLINHLNWIILVF
jgi:hypothetical protein